MAIESENEKNIQQDATKVDTHIAIYNVIYDVYTSDAKKLIFVN